MSLIEGRHAIAPPRNQQRLQLHSFHNLLSGLRHLLPILPDADAQCRFHLGFIWSGRSRARILQQSVPRIEDQGHEHNPPSSRLAQRIHDCRTRRPISVIGNQQRIGGVQIFPRRQK